MKEFYEEPIFEIIELEASDIITTSVFDYEGDSSVDTPYL